MTNWSAQFEFSRGDLELKVDLQGADRPLALIGANGAGKTTVLKILLGIETPSSGHFRCGEKLLYSSEKSICVDPENRRMAYLPQGCGLFPHLDVLDNVGFGLQTQKGLSVSEVKKLSLQALEELDVSHLKTRNPIQLSAGERQKVALARVLTMRPEMILLDEPVSALDIMARREVREILSEQLLELKIPAVLVTHDVRDVRELSADVALLDKGKISLQGCYKEISERRGDEKLHPFLKEFLGDFN